MERQLERDLLTQLRLHDVDWHGRRISNAGDAAQEQDYVTLKQLKTLIDLAVSNIQAGEGGSTTVTNNYTNSETFFTVTPSATIVINAANGINQSVTPTGNTSFSAPVGTAVRVVLEILNVGTAYDMTFDAAWKIPSGWEPDKTVGIKTVIVGVFSSGSVFRLYSFQTGLTV